LTKTANYIYNQEVINSTTSTSTVAAFPSEAQKHIFQLY